MASTNLSPKRFSWFRGIFHSLHARISFALLALCVPALVLIAIFSFQDRAKDVERIRSEVANTLNLFIAQQETDISATRTLLEALAYTPSVRDKRAKECEQIFAKLLKDDPRYAAIALLDLSGNIVCSGVLATTQDNYADRVWFKEALETKTFSIGTFQIGRVTGKPSLGLSYPVLDAQNRVTGVVYASLNLNTSNVHAQEIPMRSTAEVSIVDRNGAVLVHMPKPERWLGKTIEQNVATIRMLTEARGLMDVTESNGRTRSYLFAQVGNERSATLHAVISVDIAAEIASMTHPIEDVLVLGVIVVVLTLILINRLVDRMVIDPMNELIVSAERMQRDFSVRVALPKRRDEIYSLGKSLNDAFEMVEQSMNQLRTRDAQLTEQSQERTIVSEVNRIMARSHDSKTLFEDVCRVLVERGSFTFAWIARIDEKNKRLNVGATWGNDDGYIQSRTFDLNDPKDPAALVFRGSGPVAFNDIATDPRMEKVRDALLKRSIRSVAWFPFKNEHGIVIGGIVFYAPKPSVFTAEIVRLYEEVAQDVGFAIQSMENVSGRTLAEGRATESESRLTNVLELTPDAIAVVRDGNFVYANLKAAEILGAVSPDALRGMSFVKFVTEDRRASFADHLKALRPEKREPALELTVHRSDGTETSVEVIMASYLFEKSPAAILVFRDISQRKKDETKIESLNELRNTFIHVISHQLRAPLNAIRWQLESLLSGDLGKLQKTQEQTLETVYSAEIEMIRRIHNLLTAMDIEEGREAPKKEKVEFIALWSSVAEIMKRECHTKGLKCIVSIPRTKHPVINADREKIRSVLDTLVSNALVYTKPGGEIHVKMTMTDTTVRFEISDTGIGIPEAEQSRVFERFFRASNATSMLPDATGIGLSIAKHFINQHGGTIGFTSKEGKGSTFWIELPVVSSS